MDLDLWGFSTAPFFRLPAGIFGYGLFLAYGVLAGAVALVASVRAAGRLKLWQWLVFAGLLLTGLVLAQILVINIPANILPPPGQPVESQRPGLVLFALTPAFLAGGWLGVGPAMLVGLLTGLARGAWESYSIFTPMEYMVVSGVVAWCLRQDYRGWPARLLRRPLVAGLVVGGLWWAILIPSYFAYAPSVGLPTWDYVWSQTQAAAPVVFVQAALAGLVAEIARAGLPELWVRRRELRPPPYVSSLNRKLQFTLVPIFVAGIALLFWANIQVATEVSTSLLVGQMAGAAEAAGRGIPFFIQTGQNLIANIAGQPSLLSSDPVAQSAYLSTSLRAVPYFRQLTLLDLSLTPVAGYPANAASVGELRPGEDSLAGLALAGIPQNTIVYPVSVQDPVDAVFAAPVLDSGGTAVVGVLMGRADLANNPVMQSATNSLLGLANGVGQAFIVDESGVVIYHIDPAARSGVFAPEPSATRLDTALAGAQAYQDKAPDGTRRLVLYYPAPGHPWSVVVMVPNHVVLAQAAQISAPATALLTAVGVILVCLVALIADRVTKPAVMLAQAARRISENQLEEPVVVAGEDEIGRAGLAFERMREKLRARLEELNMLLRVAQGAASSLHLDDALPPIVQGAMAATGAAGVRLVLAPPSAGEGGQWGASRGLPAPPPPAGAAPTDGYAPPAPRVFAAGRAADLMAALDKGVLALTEHDGRAIIENLSRARAVLDVAPVAGRLNALLALPLRQERNYYGALWLGYDAPHTFSETEINFLSTLASQAAVSVANARLFEAAEQRRQHLDAILASTPDAVIVTDRNARVLLLNPAAEAAFDLVGKPVAGQPVEQVVAQPTLAKLLQDSRGGSAASTGEFEVGAGRTLFASASTIIAADGSVLGRVAVLRDVTHFKELDQMKSDFVATVSHDLRAPLTFMRGYATMMPMVGPLNEKQREFGDKILGGVEQMTLLIDDLLDLGRIEAGVGLAREPVWMKDIINEVVEALTPHAANKGLNLHLDLPPNLPSLPGDVTLLRQAVTNLVDNAIKYTAAGGDVRLRASVDEGGFSFSVADTGVGIAPADQAHLFEKFFRVRQRGSTQVKGSGLGLAIVKSIVERHGGRVFVESKLGQGSTFGFALPANGAVERSV